MDTRKEQLNAIPLNTFLRVVQSNYNILVPDNSGNGYVCPHCGNGQGEDGDGLTFTKLDDGNYHTHCFKCDYNGDYVSILGDFCYNLDCKTQFRQILDRATVDFNLQADNFAHRDRTPDAFWHVDEPNKKVKAFIDFARKNLPTWINSLPDKSFRGLSAQTLQTFGCGYSFPSDKFPYPSLIIPTSYSHWLARALVDEKDLPDEVRKNFHPKQHFHAKEVFGLPLIKNSNPVFAVEGELDAMSIHQLGFNAIAFSGSAVSKSMLNQLATLPDCTCIILMLDNDAAGSVAAPKIADKIKKLRRADGGFKNFCVVTTFLDIEGCKDANDALQLDPTALQNRLNAILAQATDTANKHNAKVAQWEQSTDDQTSKQIMPSCPADVHIPENFIFSEQGIFKIVKDDIVPVVGNPVVISRKIISHDATNGALELAIFNRRTKKWFFHFFPEEDICDTRKIVKLAGMGLPIAIGRAKYLSEYLVDMLNHENNIDAIKELNFFEQTGWTADGDFVYPEQVHGDLSNVRCDNYDYVTAFATKGDKDQWFKLALQTLRSSDTARTVFGAALAAPLINVCKTRNVQVHINSPSGNGKSAVVELAMSVFGNPEKLYNDFHGTPNHLDNLAVKFNDLPHWVDELQSASEKVLKNLPTSIYNFAGGKTKGRMNKNAEDRPRRQYRGVRITTGEMPITNATIGQGAINRVIELNPNTVIEDELAVKLHRFLKDNHGFFGKQWCLYIKNNHRKLKKFFDKWEDRFHKSDISPSHIQMLCVADAAFMGFLDMLELPNPVVQEFARLLEKDFQKFILNSPSCSASTNANRAKAFITEEIHSNTPAFIKENSSGEFYKDNNLPALGVMFYDKSVGFFPSKLRELLKNKGFPAASPIIDALSAEGCLDEPATLDKYGHKHMRLRPTSNDGNKTYLYVFNKDAFVEEKDVNNFPEDWIVEDVGLDFCPPPGI